MINISPLIMVLIIFVWGVGSVLLVAIKTKSIKSVFLKKPSIIIGDVLIIPFVGGLITYQLRGRELVEIFTPLATIILVIAGFSLALFSAVRHRLISIWWLPHMLFYAFMAFYILLFLIRGWKFGFVPWLIAVGGILTHLLLGFFYPKKFPKP